MHWGGIRRTVFGTSNGLTKAALVLMDGSVKPFIEWHQAAGASVADVSGVLMHYPFVSTFRDKVQDAMLTGRYGGTTTDEYVAYGRELARNPGLSLKRPSASRFTGLEPLLAGRIPRRFSDYVPGVGACVSAGSTALGRDRARQVVSAVCAAVHRPATCRSRAPPPRYPESVSR